MIQHPRRVAFAAAAFLAAAAAACNDNPFLPGNFAVDDRWTGSVRAGTGADTVRFRFDLRLDQERETIRGTGTIVARDSTIPVTVTGDWEYPSVRLVMRGTRVSPLTYNARFDEDTVLSVTRISTPRGDSLVAVRTPVVMPDTLVGKLGGSGLDTLTLAIGRTTPD